MTVIWAKWTIEAGEKACSNQRLVVPKAMSSRELITVVRYCSAGDHPVTNPTLCSECNSFQTRIIPDTWLRSLLVSENEWKARIARNELC